MSNQPAPPNSRLLSFVFVFTVLAAMLPAAVSFAVNSQPVNLWVFVILGTLHIVLGVSGLDGLERKGKRNGIFLYAYFSLQAALILAMLVIARGYELTWLLIFPLTSQAVTSFSSRAGAILGALLLLAVLFSGGISQSLSDFVLPALGVSAGIFFVIAFTEFAERQSAARAEVERLNLELAQANQKLRQFAAQAQELAVANERNRLAREIHDSLGHYLTVINVQLEAAGQVFERDPLKAILTMRKAQSLAQEGLADIRRSVAALRASPVENRPLQAAVGALVEESHAAGIITNFVVTGMPRPLGPQAELTLYRAAQEGLTNVRKHARASRADVRLGYRQDGSVLFVIQDNGVGGSGLNNEIGGFGLLGVKERVQLLGGKVLIHSAKGDGFTLEVELPG